MQEHHTGFNDLADFLEGSHNAQRQGKMMYNLKRKKTIRAVVAAVLAAATITQCFWAVAESAEAENNTHLWLISNALTTASVSDSLYNKYRDDNSESNSADIFEYNESGEVNYTYQLSGSVGDVSANLGLKFLHNTNDLGTAPYDSIITDKSESFLNNTNGVNFMNTVYGFGLGWSLDLPQIEYISENVAYFHNGSGNAYRIGLDTSTENGETEEVYKLCGFPYAYTIKKNMQFENEEDSIGTLQGFIGVDRYGNKDYFNLDGRFIKSEEASGALVCSVTYNEDNLISSYCGKDYTINFERTISEDSSRKIALVMSVNKETTNEDGTSSSSTETDTIYTFVVKDGKLANIINGEEDVQPETTTETDEEHGVTVTETNTQHGKVTFEYSTDGSAILANANTNAVETSLDGMDSMLLSKVTVTSDSSTEKSYAAIDETNENAVIYATDKNTTAKNESDNFLETYTVTYEKAYRDFGTQSRKGYLRVKKIKQNIVKNYRDSTKDTSGGLREFVYNDNDKVSEDNYFGGGEWYNSKGICKKNSNISDSLLYAYKEDTDHNVTISTTARHFFKEGTVTSSSESGGTSGGTSGGSEGGYGGNWGSIEDTLDDFDTIEYPYVFKTAVTKNQKGEVLYYLANGGAEYHYTYDDKGDIKELSFDNYKVTYDSNGNITSFKVGQTELNRYQYNCTADPSLATAIYYANGASISNTYDDNGNLVNIYTPDFGDRYSFTYDESNEVSSVTDYVNHRKTVYENTAIENSNETETSTDETDETETKRTAKVYDITVSESPVLLYSYDTSGDTRNITVDSISLNFSSDTQDTTNDNDETITTTTDSVALGDHVWYNEKTEDDDGLVQSDVVKLGSTRKYTHTYIYDEDKKLSSETSVVGTSRNTASYTYDDNKNIKTISDGTNTTEYFYDEAKQLVRVNDQAAGWTYIYEYDDRGNILTSRKYNYTEAEKSTLTNYVSQGDYFYTSSEEWKDKLFAFNGSFITYDNSGNPLTFGIYNYTWDMGRQLKSVSREDQLYSYTYNEDGIRTSKTVNGFTTNYVVDNKIIKAEYNDNYSIVYWYDNSGNVVGFFYTDKTAAAPVTKAYIYTKNTLGDVTGIVDSTGNIVAKYVYDPWGMVIAVTDGNGNDVSATANHIANINPIRYRGYYLDSETGFYYLQSRYYFPLWKRFINADDSQFIGTTGTAIGVNAFAYCENDSVNRTDDSGYISFWKRASYLARGIVLIVTSILAIVKAIRKGIVVSALGSWTARILSLLTKMVLGLAPLGQYWAIIMNVAIIISLVWRVKVLLYNLPRGVMLIKKAFK